MAYIRKFKTTSGATGVQVCYKKGREVVRTVHVGSANSEVGLTKLLKQAQAIIDKDKNPLFDLKKYDDWIKKSPFYGDFWCGFAGQGEKNGFRVALLRVAGFFADFWLFFEDFAF